MRICTGQLFSLHPPPAPAADPVEVNPLSFGAPSMFSGASFRSGQTVVGAELPEPAVDPGEPQRLPKGRAGAADQLPPLLDTWAGCRMLLCRPLSCCRAAHLPTPCSPCAATLPPLTDVLSPVFNQTDLWDDYFIRQGQGGQTSRGDNPFVHTCGLGLLETCKCSSLACRRTHIATLLSCMPTRPPLPPAAGCPPTRQRACA